MTTYGHYNHKAVSSCVHKVFSDCIVKTTDDVAESEQEKAERREFLSKIYVSQDLKEWFPAWW